MQDPILGRVRHIAQLLNLVKAQPKNRRGATVFALSTKRIDMSKAQKGNKENKKPKTDKNRSKNVSAYKAAQSLGKPAGSRFGKKT